MSVIIENGNLKNQILFDHQDSNNHQAFHDVHENLLCIMDLDTT